MKFIIAEGIVTADIRMAVHHIPQSLVLSQGIHIRKDGRAMRPFLVVSRDSSIPGFLPYRIGKDKTSPGPSKLSNNILNCLRIQSVVPIVPGDGVFNGFLTSNIQLV